MDLSNRISSFQASPIRRLVPFADKARKNGIHVYHLNIGQPDIKTPPQVLEAIRGYNHEIIAYGQSEGDQELREALPKYYSQYNIDVQANNIMITTGGSEAIQFVLMTICDPGDEVIVPEPYYTNVGSFAKGAGVILQSVTSRFEEGFSLPDISEFEKMIHPHTKAIMLCSPNNPTGYIYSEKELKQLLELVERKDIFLIVDEVYREFCYDGHQFISALTFTDYADRVIVVDSFSKRYSMCGARIGALVTKNKDVIDGATKLAQARLCPPDIEQTAALAALQTPRDYLIEVQKEYQKRRDFLVSELHKIPGVDCSIPKGAFYLIAKLPVLDAEDFCLFLLKDFSYQKETLMLAPANGFYVDETLGKDEVRIAYVLNVEDLRNAMVCLKVALEEYNLR
jgi:aspartate aminotransferase